MAVVLTLVQTKQIRINIHKRNNTKNTVQTIKNTVNTSTDITKTPIQLSNPHTLQNAHIHTPTHYKTHTYTHPTLQNPHIHTPTHYKTHTYTHPHITKPTHTHTHTLQNKLEQPQCKIGNKWNSHDTIKYPQYKKVKVKWSRYKPAVAQRVGRGIALLFHDRGTRRGWVVSSTPRPHFTPRERHGTHCTGGWVGPRAGLDGRNISSPPGFDHGPSSP